MSRPVRAWVWACIALLTLACVTRADVVPPDPAAVGPDVEVEALRLMLRPLTADELEPVADVWVARLRERVAEASGVRLAARGVAGQDRARLLERAALLELERDRVADRTRAVLDALALKGGDPGDRRDYVVAVARGAVDPTDLEALWAAVRAWLVDARGGVWVLSRTGLFLLVLAVTWGVARVVGGVVRRAVTRVPGVRHRNQLLIDFLGGMAGNVVLVVGFVAALGVVGVNIGPLVAAIGAAGLVVGLALQGTLSNFASGILILLYRPYDVGHAVEVAGGVSGKVDAMSLVSTTILTFDNRRILIPNNNIWGNTVTNLTALPTRRVDLTFSVSYGDDLDRVVAILRELCASHPLVLADPEPNIRVASHGDSGINILCRPWARTENYWPVFWDLQKTVKQRFDAEGITIPYPQRDVHLYNA